MQRNSMPLISVITPSFNSASFIERTIESVQEQDYPAIEHIVIDGGSMDGTVEILKSHKHIAWISEPDKGQSDALNKGLKMATGDVIAWINADDTYEPGAFSTAIDYLTAQPDVDVVYGNCFFINENDGKTGLFPSREFDLREYLLEDFIPQQAAFFRKQAIEAIGGWDDNLHMVMDYDLFLRLGKRHRLQCVDDTLGNFRLYAGTKTMSAGTTQSRREKIGVLNRFFADETLPVEIQSFAPKAISYAEANLNLAFAFEQYQDKNIETAKSYLNDAIEQAPELLANNYALLINDILTWIGRCVQDSPAGFVENVLNGLPAILEEEKDKLQHQILPPTLEAELRLAYQAGDRQRIQRRLIDLLHKTPASFKNHGVLSIGIETLFGSDLAAQIRRLANLVPSKTSSNS